MTVKSKLKELLNTEEYISGAEIARQLGVTRSSVSKSIKELKEDGVDIDVKLKVGYKLNKYRDFLLESEISKNLHTDKIGRKLIIFDEIDSTNNYAKQLARNGEPEGTVIISDCQVKGKGRLGRDFVSPKDAGLYFSVILRPDFPMELSQLITSCAAVAVAETLDEVCNVETNIKWVNDIFLNGRKLCGILTEASVSFEAGNLDFAIVGIGINVFNKKSDMPKELDKIVTSIEEETGNRFSRNIIAAKLCDKLEEKINDIESRSFLDVYRKKSNLIGKYVLADFNNEQKKAEVIDIDDNAAIVLRLEDDKIVHMNSGEVRVFLEK
jgi:BirA family biotin operon repressor/biotin-[acetyl-CoA-carboxylase] ligase